MKNRSAKDESVSEVLKMNVGEFESHVNYENAYKKTNDEYIDNERELIIELVNKIDNIDNLKRICELAKYLYVYK